jgi:hypothetical protein
MEVRFADEHRAGCTEALRNWCIGSGHAIRKHVRGRGCGHPGDIDQVLQRNGQAMQRATIPAGRALGIHGPRRCPRGIAINSYECVGGGVMSGDCIQAEINEVGG